MKTRILASLLVVSTFFFFSPVAQAAWVADADFNALNTTTLDGQAGGSGWSSNWGTGGSYQCSLMSVQTSVVYEGAKAVGSSGVSTCERDLTTALSGNGNILYVAIYSTGTQTTDPSNYTFRTTGDATRLRLDLSTNGNLTLHGTTDVALTTYSSNTWYVVRLTINVTSNTATAAWSTGAYGSAGTFSAESSAVTMISSGNITGLYPTQQNVATYFDYISATSPFVAASAPTSILGLVRSFWIW